MFDLTKRMKILQVILSFAFFCVVNVNAQEKRRIELTAQEILARVDYILAYPEGCIKGRMVHITPDGKSVNIELVGYIAGEDSHFRFSTKSRGEEVRILYNLNGEDIWVYNIHSITLFNKRGIDKFDPILRTNFYYIDLSNYDLQSNYTAEISGDAYIKGNDCYRLNLHPILQGGMYGLLTLYVDKNEYIPLRIDFHDTDKVIIKTLSIVKVAQKNGRSVPLRYDMLDIRKGTVTLLEFNEFDQNIAIDKKMFRHENLEEK